jgi:hypothetical protein
MGSPFAFDQLPMTRELRRRHPFEQWFGRVLFNLSVGLN